MAETPGAGSLIADFIAFSRRRSAAAVALIFAGALLEGAGVVMLHRGGRPHGLLRRGGPQPGAVTAAGGDGT